jgi:hypothetical protein
MTSPRNELRRGLEPEQKRESMRSLCIKDHEARRAQVRDQLEQSWQHERGSVIDWIVEEGPILAKPSPEAAEGFLRNVNQTNREPR